MSAPLDPRLRTMAVTIAELASVYTDHHDPAGSACPNCGHQATGDNPACPSFTVARSLLPRRRNEKPGDIPDWIAASLSSRRKKIRA
jgi:hypothetical protein